jgi:hypothetical protein
MVASSCISQTALRTYVSGWFVLTILACTCLNPRVAFACSACAGKDGYSLDTTTSCETLRDILVDVDPGCDQERRDEFLFLYPFKVDKPQEITPLWELVYQKGSAKFSPPPAADPLDSALQSGDWKTARKEAQEIVDHVLDMPGTIAQQYQPALVKAVEFLEIQPLFDRIDAELMRSALWGNASSDKSKEIPPEIVDILEMRHLDRAKVSEIMRAKPHHPRIATLRFVALRQEFAAQVPDGWVFDIRNRVPRETWNHLESSVNRWLKDYPQHPLADLVLLWKTRILYFNGDVERAWRVLFYVYPRRLPRVLYDMRYLLVETQDERPVAFLQAIKDPLLFTALLPLREIDVEAWQRWWQVSENNMAQAWAVNLQERLLAKVPGFGELPRSFPTKPRNPTPLWGKLRAVALMQAGKWEEAREQLLSLKGENEQALLLATFYLRRGQPLLAVQLPDVPELIRLYLVRVILSDEKLQQVKADEGSVLRKEIVHEQGVRLAAQGKWAEAAQKIRTTEPECSKLWQEVARLQKDKSPKARLRLARFFRDHRGKLFYGNDTDWWHPEVRSRYGHVRAGKNSSVKHVDSDLPWTEAQELDAVTKHFLGTTESWLALQAYVDWLSKAEPSPQMRTVIKEADFCYNRLIGQGYWNWGFWTDYLVDNPAVKELRKAGIRAKDR